MDVGNASVSLW